MSRSTEQLAALTAAAAAWEGTPWCPGGSLRGAGVCCHHLVAGVLRDAGWLPSEVQIPEGPTGWARAQSESIMETFLDGSPLFSSIPLEEAGPGDILGCRLGRCVHHLALVLPAGRVIHAYQGHGAVIAPGLPQTWAARVVRAWRVL